MNQPSEAQNIHHSDLKKVFKEYGDKLSDLAYRHPFDATLKNNIRQNMGASEAARHLLDVADKKALNIYVIKNNKTQGFFDSNDTIYLGFPAEKKEVTPELTLELVAALREAEQHFLGMHKEPETNDPLKIAAYKHAKNLDIIVHMCRFAHETVEATGNDAYIECLEETGHGGLYDAYVREFSHDKIVDTYYGNKS